MSQQVIDEQDRGATVYESPSICDLGSLAELTRGKSASVPDQLGGTNATPPGFYSTP